MKISQNFEKSPNIMGKYILQVKVEKQNRSGPSITLWACVSNVRTQGNVASPQNNNYNENTWGNMASPHAIFFNKAQGLLKNKNELFSVLHALMYKITCSSILKISENLSNVLCPFTNWIKRISNTHKKL
jgi:hypothetical protein